MFFLGMTGVEGCQLRIPQSGSYRAGGGYYQYGSLKGEIVDFPEAVIEARDTPLPEALRMTFNAVWNAFGFAEVAKLRR